MNLISEIGKKSEEAFTYGGKNSEEKLGTKHGDEKWQGIMGGYELKSGIKRGRKRGRERG